MHRAGRAHRGVPGETNTLPLDPAVAGDAPQRRPVNRPPSVVTARDPTTPRSVLR